MGARILPRPVRRYRRSAEARGCVRRSADHHPDVDLADATLNSSGVPWHSIYYQNNYPRLQRAKAKWDPRDVFNHALSIRPG
ncbi:MAG: BBE domain-containing protein [Gemmatimonadaceae bacterium]|nr:BBE domain-containing protein [Gemmatimonadaceae bacterium]